MARACDVCGKQARMGNSVELRGKAKYLGGVGTKITGITRRQFKPNLQRVRVTTANGTNESKMVCTQCLRSGAVRKAVKQAPFKLPAGQAAVVAAASAKAAEPKGAGTKGAGAKGAGTKGAGAAGKPAKSSEKGKK